jgi:hypothetical protein
MKKYTRTHFAPINSRAQKFVAQPQHVPNHAWSIYNSLRLTYTLEAERFYFPRAVEEEMDLDVFRCRRKEENLFVEKSRGLGVPMHTCIIQS